MTVPNYASWADALTRYRATYDDLTKACGVVTGIEHALYKAKPPAPKLAVRIAGAEIEISERILQQYEREELFTEETPELRRRLDAYHSEVERLTQVYGLTAAEERRDTIGEINEQALHDLIITPSPTLAALIEKIEIIRSEYSDREELGPILADLKRLSGASHA